MENHPVRNYINITQTHRPHTWTHQLEDFDHNNCEGTRLAWYVLWNSSLSLSLSLYIYIYIYIYSWWLWWKPHNYGTGGTNSYLYIHQESLISSQVSWYSIDRLVVMLAIKLTNNQQVSSAHNFFWADLELCLNLENRFLRTIGLTIDRVCPHLTYTDYNLPFGNPWQNPLHNKTKLRINTR